MKVIPLIFLLCISFARAEDLSNDDINTIKKFCISFTQIEKLKILKGLRDKSLMPHYKPQDPRRMLQGDDLPILPNPGGHSSNPNQPLKPRSLSPGEARPKPINPEEFE